MPKILFIEDELSLQKTMVAFLTGEHYTMLSAYDGEEGLKMAAKEKPDLILLDLVLPKMNGFEVLQSLKSDAVTESIPVIVFTNLEGTRDVEKAIALGATTYLVKANYSLEEVIQKIKSSLGQ